MKPFTAWALVLVLAAATAGLFIAPWWALLATAAVALVSLRRGRMAYAAFAGITVALDALLLAWANPGTGTVFIAGPIALGANGAAAGAVGGLRLVAIVGLNLAFVSVASPARWLDGLRLPRRPTAFLAALLISIQDLGAEAHRKVEVAVLLRPEAGAIRRAVSLVPALMVSAMQRAQVRRDALHMAGIHTSRHFVPIIAIASLAIAGRLAFVAVPNVALTFVVVFAGGIVFGPWIAAWAAVIGMLVSNLLLSGLTPTGFVNVPAMALVAMLGGALRRVDFRDGHPTAGAIAFASIGILATFLFSVTADTAEWMLVPEFRGNLRFLQARIATGLAFNLLPAAINGVLFATIVGPVQAAFRPLPNR